jgi:hypothetical protein
MSSPESNRPAPLALLVLALAHASMLLLLTSGCVLLADTDVSDEALGTVAGSFEACGASAGPCAGDAACVAPGRANPTVGFCAPACVDGDCGAGAACVLQLPGASTPSACALTCSDTQACPEGLLCQAFDGVSLCTP